MKSNVGNIDRVIRLVIGIGIAIGGIIFESYWGLIGVGIMTTAVFGYSPLCALLGFNTTTVER